MLTEDFLVLLSVLPSQVTARGKKQVGSFPPLSWESGKAVISTLSRTVR